MAKIVIDIDEQNALQDKSIAWDFAQRVGGVLYSTRQPTAAEADQLEHLDRMTGEAASELIAGLFDPKPDLRAWSLEQIQTSLAAYWGYLVARSREKAQAMRAKVAELVDQSKRR
jgi:hypothetical protein